MYDNSLYTSLLLLQKSRKIFSIIETSHYLNADRQYCLNIKFRTTGNRTLDKVVLQVGEQGNDLVWVDEHEFHQYCMLN